MIDKISMYMLELWRLNALALVDISLACYIYWKSKSTGKVSYHVSILLSVESTNISCTVVVAYIVWFGKMI